MIDINAIRARLNISHAIGSIDSRDEDIAALLREVERLNSDIDQLNDVLRNAGWGQGEIDNAAVVVERLEADARRWRHVRYYGVYVPVRYAPWHITHAWRFREVADETVDKEIDRAASQGREVSGGA